MKIHKSTAAGTKKKVSVHSISLNNPSGKQGQNIINVWDFKQVKNTKETRHSNNYKSDFITLREKVCYKRPEV